MLLSILILFIGDVLKCEYIEYCQRYLSVFKQMYLSSAYYDAKT